MLTNLTIVLITLLVTYTVLTRTALRIQRARKAKQMGATLPPRVNNGILGWYGLWLVIQNARSMKLPHTLGKRFANGPTWLTPVAGNEPINTIDPENVKAILATQFKDFCLGIRHRALSPSIGDGIFTLDGEGWTHSRALLRPQFSRQQISRVHSLERLMQILFKLIRKENGEYFDLQNLFFMFTLDSATEFLYGASVDTLADLLGEPVEGDHGGVGEEVRKAYQQSINNAQDISAIRTRLQGLYWIAGNIYQRNLYQKSNKGVKDFSQFFVDKALNTSKEKLKEMEDSDNYVFLYELVKSTRNPVVIRDQLINILVAGRDTTASLLSFTFYTLGRRPDVLKKLRAAILEDFGTSPTRSPSSLSSDVITCDTCSMRFSDYTLRFLSTLEVLPGTLLFPEEEDLTVSSPSSSTRARWWPTACTGCTETRSTGVKMPWSSILIDGTPKCNHRTRAGSTCRSTEVLEFVWDSNLPLPKPVMW